MNGGVWYNARSGTRTGGFDRRAFGLGILALALVTAIYAATADPAGTPLGLFGLPSLLLAVVAGPVEVAIVVALSLAAAATAGELVSEVDGSVLATRLVILAIAGGVAALLAWHRRRGELRLQESLTVRRVVDALQTRLVTVPLPPDGIATGVRYVPGDERLAVGGDFLDAVTLPDGALGFIIGDVSGHGARPAAFGVVVRAGWKAIAIEHPEDPCYWLDALQRSFFEDNRYDGFATALVGRLMPGEPTIELCSAGHCWPVVVNGDTRLVNTCNSMPLGVGKNVKRQSMTLELAPGERLLVYTDGLIENRKPAPGTGRWSETDLIDWVWKQPTFELDELLAWFGPNGFDDDVALMTIEPQASRDPEDAAEVPTVVAQTVRAR